MVAAHTRVRRLHSYLALLGLALTVAVSPARLRAASQGDPERLLRQAAAATFRRDVYMRVPVVFPSPAYYNPYLRDSFWTAQALGNKRFAVRVLDAFAAAVRRDGDPPTLFLDPYRRPRYHADESAALLLIWAWRNHHLYGDSPPRPVLARALAYLVRHATAGYYRTPAGMFRSWWDGYRHAVPSTLSYNQGLYAVALRCAPDLGLRVPRATVSAAEHAYQALFNRRLGYLPVSDHLHASDASALTGEFLSLWLFRRPILSNAAVLNTLAHLTPFGAGFRVVALPHAGPRDGGGFPLSTALGAPGDYQNGGSWLLYDALTLAAAGLHGLPDALPRLRARLALEFSHGAVLHEYLRTSPALRYFSTEPPYRDLFAWDTFVLVIDRVLHDPTRRAPGRRPA